MQLTEREMQRLDKNICRPYGANILNLAMEAEMTKAYDFCRRADICRENIIRLNDMRRCCSRDELQGIKDRIRENRCMIRFWTFCNNVFRDRKRRMSKLLRRRYAALRDRLGDMSELFAACPDGKGNRRIYETDDIVDAYVKHVASEEHIPYAYVRIRQDAGTGRLIVQYTEPRLEFQEEIHCGKRRKYLQCAVENICEWRPISLSDKKSWPGWRPIISDVLVTPAGDFKITAQSWWEMLQRIGHLNIEKAFDTQHDNICISMKIYRHPYKWNWY